MSSGSWLGMLLFFLFPRSRYSCAVLLSAAAQVISDFSNQQQARRHL